MSTVTLHLGDCLDVMRSMPDACVDAVVCDPPYGLAFMGKEWDDFGRQRARRGRGGYNDRGILPGYGRGGTPEQRDKFARRSNAAFQQWATEWATEALRVAKPGAHILAFGGTRTYHRLACAIEDAGWQIKDCLSWLYGSGFPKHKTLLKPAWEPVVMAAKPGAARVVNVDACRLTPGDGVDREGEPSAMRRYRKSGEGFTPTPGVRGGSAAGRWPANVMLDEEAAALLDAQGGKLSSGVMRANTARSARSVCYGAFSPVATLTDTYGDAGGASRFFYVAKASRSEREAGLREAGTTHDGYGTIQEFPPTRVRNHHPTVKPVALMRWLVRLVTPPGGIVLDPFTGSGTTALACIAEGRAFVGAEREPEYHAIAEARIAHAQGVTLPSDEQRGLDFGGAA